MGLIGCVDTAAQALDDRVERLQKTRESLTSEAPVITDGSCQPNPLVGTQRSF